ncbi:hypothetical protein BVX99_01495 [bacterium F16]|nr:hypothetical protein BVX99_01495 [bacterium F16]
MRTIKTTVRTKRKRSFRRDSEKTIKINVQVPPKTALKDFRTVQYTPMLDSNISFTDHSSSSTFYYNQDERQSVKNLTDSSGTVVQSYDYTAYGDKLDSLTSGSVTQRYTYNGRELSETSGDYYFRNRIYSADLGAFLSRDPLGFIDGPSLYSGYFGQAVSVDPMGTMVGKVVPCHPHQTAFCNRQCATGGGVKKCVCKITRRHPMLGWLTQAFAYCNNHGTCESRLYGRLRAAKQLACNRPRKCKGCCPRNPKGSGGRVKSRVCGDWWGKILANQQCFNARLNVMNTCFRGGDQRHKNELAAVRRTMAECRRKRLACNCPNRF